MKSRISNLITNIYKGENEKQNKVEKTNHHLHASNLLIWTTVYKHNSMFQFIYLLTVY